MSKTFDYYAIIVAGGSGSRMNSDLPKQFLNLAGKPVLMHTIEAFYNNQYQPKIILVLAEKYFDTWKSLSKKYSFTIPHELIKGGEQRFTSVKNGLSAIKNSQSIIAIHDAVRPLVNQKIISESFEIAGNKGNAVTAISSKDSVRRKNKIGNSMIPRNEVFLIQTPQTFLFAQLKKAYEQLFDPQFTDDASVAESCGFEINLIDGDEQNIKITYRDDLFFAEWILKNRGEH